MDVGKSEHHACALDPAGKRLYDKPPPNDEAALTGVLGRLTEHDRVLVVVDQPAAIGALTIAVARSLGIDVGYLPGLAMRRIADLYPGEGKTDERDAFIIADAARTMPHTLRQVRSDDETLAELTVLAGYDDDLAAQSTRLSNRLHDALLHIYPALERLLAKQLDRPSVLALLAAGPAPDALRALGVEGIAEALLEAHPLAAVLRSMPGVGLRTALKILTIVGDGTAFPTPGHLASYAGLSPVTRRSGSSIKGETHSYRCNHALKSALFLSASASLVAPASRAYDDRKRAEDKKHNAALACLARRRVDVLHAMPRDHVPHRHPVTHEPTPTATAA